MSIKIRNTELHPHPMWEKLTDKLPIADMQGYVVQATEHALIQATMGSKANIPVCFLEAAEYDTASEFTPSYFFPETTWQEKLTAARFFRSQLYFLSHGLQDHYLFRLHEVTTDARQNIVFQPKMVFPNESTFINWWGKVKIMSQTKKLVEAKARQANTIFDHVIERYGLQWGGNIDALIFSKDLQKVRAIVEIRQSRRTSVKKYDPAQYFEGTANKGGDFKSWLPLVYLQKAYKVPLILVTLSTLDPGMIGWAQVEGLNYKRLFYRYDIPPTQNAGADFEIFTNWLDQVC